MHTQSKPRRLELRLSDEDVLRIAQKAADHGLTVAQLIESFLADLVGGTQTNGSDERLLARQWLDRAWPAALASRTFLRYLIAWDGLEEVLQLWAEVKSAKEDIAYYAVHPEKAQPGEVADIQTHIRECQDVICRYWDRYAQLVPENRGFVGEMKTVLAWQRDYRRFAGEESHARV